MYFVACHGAHIHLLQTIHLYRVQDCKFAGCINFRYALVKSVIAEVTTLQLRVILDEF